MQESKFKTILAIVALGVFGIITFGLIWFFFLGPTAPVGLGWYLFSFASGLSMIVLPCTLPLAFVIVPLSMSKGPAKGLGIALMFGLGVAIMLSVYGIIAAVIGEVAIGSLGAPLEVVKNWLYLVAGLFAYLFALGELGFIKFHMPTYTGSAPAFIQKQQDYIKALLLGLFLGNVGIGCPHPATPVILTRIAASGDIFYGWLLFFVHAMGRVLPLLLLAILGILGVNALSWLVARKDKIERTTGWGMIFVAAFILVLGLFSHDWWVYSGQHTIIEELTGEEKFLGIIISRFHLPGVSHTHGVPTGTGLFGLPLWLGNWVLVLLWIIPIWWAVWRKEKRLIQLNQEVVATPTPTNGANPPLQSIKREIESHVMPYAVANAIIVSLLFVVIFVWALPARFYNKSLVDMGMKMGDTQPHMMAGHSGTVYHEGGDVKEGPSVNLSLTPKTPEAESLSQLDFFVSDQPQNRAIPSNELQIEQEKIMHVIGVRDDLNDFFHIHPNPTSTQGLLTTNYTFKKPGVYKIWSEIKYNNTTYTFGHPLLFVSGEGSTDEKTVSFGRSIVVNNYRVRLNLDEPGAKNYETELMFEVHDAAGNEVAVLPYLGASMHLSIIEENLTQFIHTHPVSNTHANAIRLIPVAYAGGMHESTENSRHGIVFRATFPEEGNYKLFAQFRPQDANLGFDESLIASFWVHIESERPRGISNWWIHLFVSVIFIIVLSWGVKRYLQVQK